MKIERNDGLSGLEKRRSGIVIAKQVTKKNVVACKDRVGRRSGIHRLTASRR
jgi:hypothetical protein